MSENTENKSQNAIQSSDDKSDAKKDTPQPKNKADQNAKEYGGRKDGLDPTRFGDWEKNGRCIDF